MKKTVSFVLVLVFLLSGVLTYRYFSEEYVPFSLKDTGKLEYENDLDLIKAHITEMYKDDANATEQIPKLMASLINVTPDGMEGKCKFYRVPQETFVPYINRYTYMICEGVVYPIGYYRIGGVVCRGDMLYYVGQNPLKSSVWTFLYSFNFQTKERRLADISGTVAIYPSEDGERLEVYDIHVPSLVVVGTSEITKTLRYSDVREIKMEYTW